MECKSCGANIPETSTQCPYCQAPVVRATQATPTSNSSNTATAAPNKVTAGICGILLGALGIHKFILGYQKAGLIMLCVTVGTCGYGGIVFGLIGLIEGIIYLTKSDEEFVKTYVNNKKDWF